MQPTRESHLFSLGVQFWTVFTAEKRKIKQPTPDFSCLKKWPRMCPETVKSENGCGWIDLPERPAGSRLVGEADRECVLRKEADREGKCYGRSASLRRARVADLRAAEVPRQRPCGVMVDRRSACCCNRYESRRSPPVERPPSKSAQQREQWRARRDSRSQGAVVTDRPILRSIDRRVLRATVSSDACAMRSKAGRSSRSTLWRNGLPSPTSVCNRPSC